MFALRCLFLFSVVVAVGVILHHGRWEARYRTVEGTWIIDLDTAPTWRPPSKPAFDRFQEAFDDLPPHQPHGTSIVLLLKWRSMIIDSILCVWGITAVFAVVYLRVKTERRDFSLHCIASVAAALTGSAAICVALWIILGGWGPPQPLLFGVLGLTAGVVLGAKTYARTAHSTTVD